MPQFQQKLDPASNQVVRRIRVDGVPEGVVDLRVLSGSSSTGRRRGRGKPCQRGSEGSGEGVRPTRPDRRGALSSAPNEKPG